MEKENTLSEAIQSETKFASIKIIKSLIDR